ncbi:MAG: NPCBM/NEW2 domain-containing protein [Planctomycetes bacterium]|nr:NPCBM/NEW2 domain-containing protein [Planctomycetota bacterium]
MTWFESLFPVLILAAAAPLPSDDAARPLSVEVESIDGTSRGILQGMTVEGGAATFQLAGRTLPFERVIRIVFAPELTVRRDTSLVLEGGDELLGGITAGARDAVEFSSFALDSVRVPMEAIRAILFRSRFPDEAAAATLRGEILHSPPPRDVVYAADGGRIEGVIEAIDGLAVKIRSPDVGPLEIAHSRIRAIAIAPIQTRERPAAAGPGAVLVFRDGSILSGVPVALDGDRLRFDARALGPLVVSARRLHALETRGGLCQYLSDLEPSAVDERTFFGPQLWPYRRDANAMGGPIALQGKRYRRGLGVHSYSKLTYRLDGRYARFQAVVGLDDAARSERPDPSLGNVVFRVIVDGETRFDSGPMTVKDGGRPIDVDVRGAREIAIEVDFGEGFHARDRADWADARLIRAEGTADRSEEGRSP